MADMDKARVIRTYDGNAPLFMPFALEGGTSAPGAFSAGDVVVINVAGFIQKAADGQDLLLGVAGDTYDTANDAQGDLKPVILLAPPFRNIIEIQSSDGATSCVQASVGLIQDHLDDANGDPEVDVGASTDDVYAIVDFDDTAARPRLHVTGGLGCFPYNSDTRPAALT